MADKKQSHFIGDPINQKEERIEEGKKIKITPPPSVPSSTEQPTKTSSDVSAEKAKEKQ